jgi:hypothetical protein
MYWRVGLAALLAALGVAAPAAAEIRVLSASGTVMAVPVRDHHTRPLRWTDDGAGLLVARYERVLRVSLDDGAITRVPALDKATAIGPGGRSAIAPDYEDYVTLRAADGAAVATLTSTDERRPWISGVSWSADGRLAAIVVDEAVKVLDADTGAVIASVVVPGIVASSSLSAQAFSPDGSALVVSENGRVTRIDVTTGARTVLDVSPHGSWSPPAWSSSGAIAVTGDDRVRLIGAPVREIRSIHSVAPALWTSDGSRLSYVQQDVPKPCADVRASLRTVVPGASAQTLLATAAQVDTWAWSPDGEQVAVGVGPDPNRRGKRHPWPRHIPRTYEMFTRAGDAAVRTVVVRAALGLRQGAGRAKTMQRVRLGLDRVYRHHEEAGDSAVQEAVADELDRWLHAAGFIRIDALEEIDC